MTKTQENQSPQSLGGELDYSKKKKAYLSRKEVSKSMQDVQEVREEEKNGSLDSAYSNEIQKFTQKPAIYLDVNLGSGRYEPLMIKEEENVQDAVESFAKSFSLNQKKKEKLF
mmetsp:Transcript_7901/g.7411  ORF Transcript_7901/g.7411 Transcript_7901/m.7411 type:complete len:113 (+) Transcript_7901:2002-2340(+)